MVVRSRRKHSAAASRALAILLAAGIALVSTTARQAQGHDEIILPVDGDRVFSVVNYSLDKGDEVDYSYTATGAVEFIISCYFAFEMPFPQPIQVLLVIEETSASGTFTAPYDNIPSNGSWVYRFGFKNLENSAVTVQYDIHRPWITSELMILLVFLTLGSILIVVFIAMMAMARRHS